MKLFIAEKPSMAKEIANVVSEISNVKIKKIMDTLPSAII